MMGLADNPSTLLPGRTLAIAGGVLAFAGLAGAVSWLGWTFAKPMPPLPAQSIEAAVADRSGELAERFARIPDATMFASGLPAQTPASSGAFKLFAVRAGRDGLGSAIISANGSPQTSYAVGEEIAPGVRLANIGAQWAEIEADGVRTVLTLQDAAAGPQNAADARYASLLTPPLAPVDGPRGGFRITSQADLSLLAGAGLQVGDIVLKVDGAEASPSSFSEYARRLQTGGSLEVVYERNGQMATTRIGSQIQ